MAPKSSSASKAKKVVCAKEKHKKKTSAKPVARTRAASKKKQPRPKHRNYFTDPNYNFFMLPIELRDKVYKYLAHEAHEDGKLEILPDGTIRRRALSGNLLRVCKNIYEEYTAAIFRTRPIVSAMDFAHFQPILASVCGTGLALIKELVLVRSDNGFTGMSHALTRELRSLGHTSVPILRRLPHLPALKTITIRFQSPPKLLTGIHTARPFVPREDLLAQLPNIKTGRTHFLRQYMRTVGDDDSVNWKIEFASQIVCYPVQQSNDVVVAFVEDFKICIRAKIIIVEKKYRKYHHLQLEDDATGSTDQFGIWYKVMDFNTLSTQHWRLDSSVSLDRLREV